jgi:hypothetical protein
MTGGFRVSSHQIREIGWKFLPGPLGKNITNRGKQISTWKTRKNVLWRKTVENMAFQRIWRLARLPLKDFRHVRSDV